MTAPGAHAFRFPYDKYEDEVALYANFRHLQEYLRKLSTSAYHSYEVIVKPSNSTVTTSADIILTGSNDDVDIQAAIDDGFMSFFFLDGTIDISAALDLPNQCLIHGSGMGVTNFVGSAAVALFTTNGEGDLSFQDFTADGDDTATQMFNTLVTEDHWRAHVLRVEAKNMTGSGMQFITGGSDEGSTVLDSYIHDNGADGISVDSTHLKVFGSIIENNAGHGVDVANSTSAVATVIGNFVNNNTSKGVNVAGANGTALVLGNVFVNNGTDAPDGDAAYNNVGGTVSTISAELIQDIVGAMVTGNTETGIAVTYEDGDGTLDFVLDSEITTFFGATDMTGAEAETLTDGSNADALHAHSGGSMDDFLLAADSGTPETIADGNTLTVTGGTGIFTTVAATDTVTVAIDSTVATLAGSETLTNKTINTASNTITIVEADISDLAHTTARTDEEIQDVAGGMVTGNTETLITVTYQDADGTIDFVVDNDLSNYDNSSSLFITPSSSDTLTNKTINGDNNTLSNLDIGNEVDWAVISDVADIGTFASGDKLLAFEAGVGMRKIDFDDLPSGSGISNVVEDTTPQLGGNLDVNGNSIVTTSNADLTLAPNGTGQVLFPDGSATDPAMSFTSDVDTGIYRVTTNTVGILAGGDLNLTVSSSGADIQLEDGTDSAPSLSFDSDGNTGLYRVGTDQLGLTTGGSVRWTVYSYGMVGTETGGVLLKHDNGTVGAPAYSFSGDADTGLYRESTNIWALASTGALSARGTSTNVYLTAARNNTTASAANTLIQAADGRIFRSTSSLRYKPGWTYVDEDWLASLDMPQPIAWHDEQGGLMVGFGTEHVYDMLPAATQDFGEDDLPDNYDVRSLVAVLSAKIKRLERINNEHNRCSCNKNS